MPRDRQVVTGNVAGAKSAGPRRKAPNKPYHQPSTYPESSRRLRELNEAQNNSQTQSRELQCSLCLENLSAPPKRMTSDNICRRCGSLICVSCRARSSHPTCGHMCTECAGGTGFAWLFQKTRNGANLLSRTLEYCGPRTVRLVNEVLFSSVGVRTSPRHEKRQLKRTGAPSRVTISRKEPQPDAAAREEKSNVVAPAVKGVLRRRCGTKAAGQRCRTAKGMARPHSTEARLRSPPPSPSRTPSQPSSSMLAAVETPLKLGGECPNMLSNSTDPTVGFDDGGAVIPQDTARATVVATAGSHGSGGDGCKRGGVEMETQISNQFLRCDGLRGDPRCFIYSYSNEMRSSSQLSATVPGDDSPPPRFPNFSKFLDDHEGLRHELDVSDPPRIQQLFSEKDEDNRNYSGLLTVETAEGEGHRPFGVAECEEMEDDYSSPPKLALNFCKLGLFLNRDACNGGKNTCTQPLTSRGVCSSFAHAGMNVGSRTPQTSQKNSCGLSGTISSGHALTSRVVRGGPAVDSHATTGSRLAPARLMGDVCPPSSSHTSRTPNGKTLEGRCGAEPTAAITPQSHGSAVVRPYRTSGASGSCPFKTPRGLFNDDQLRMKEQASGSPRFPKGSASCLLPKDKDESRSTRISSSLAVVKARWRTPLTTRHFSPGCLGEGVVSMAGASSPPRHSTSATRLRTGQVRNGYSRTHTPLQRVHSSRLIPTGQSAGRCAPCVNDAGSAKPQLPPKSSKRVELIPDVPLTVNPARGRAVGSSLNGKNTSKVGRDPCAGANEGGARHATASRLVSQRTWTAL